MLGDLEIKNVAPHVGWILALDSMQTFVPLLFIVSPTSVSNRASRSFVHLEKQLTCRLYRNNKINIKIHHLTQDV